MIEFEDKTNIIKQRVKIYIVNGGLQYSPSLLRNRII